LDEYEEDEAESRRERFFVPDFLFDSDGDLEEDFFELLPPSREGFAPDLFADSVRLPSSPSYSLLFIFVGSSLFSFRTESALLPRLLP